MSDVLTWTELAITFCALELNGTVVTVLLIKNMFLYRTFMSDFQ